MTDAVGIPQPGDLPPNDLPPLPDPDTYPDPMPDPEPIPPGQDPDLPNPGEVNPPIYG
ncbi:hypothetical protein [Falsirhodobacter sp. 20TX0035]|uniref:hypothetical protein n=1 Tax=Falsirhodobacter sp. 20TX0035 TaxID=3022019 RepID=UPI00232B42B0|nr:hypothetical protein [Falsirhodobacter sp. 20TX0035]MDB6452209.1 hypothetical protein [Falsirhodobacter sp. 20TX0035]